MTKQHLRSALLLATVLLVGCELSPPAAPMSIPGPPGLQSVTTAAKQTGVVYEVSAISHGGPYSDPTWISSRPGTTSKTTLFTKWTGDAVVITPTGSQYALTDEGQMSVRTRSGKIVGVTFRIQDVPGPDGIQHETDELQIDPVTPSGAGFVLHVHRNDVEVYRLKGHGGGPRVGTIGTISVGDIVFAPSS